MGMETGWDDEMGMGGDGDGDGKVIVVWGRLLNGVS